MGGNFQETAECGHRVITTIEPKHKLIQVRLKIFGLYPVMDSDQPRLKISKNLMDVGGQFSGSLRPALNVFEVVISLHGIGRVTPPTIALDRAPQCHVGRQKRLDLVSTGRFQNL